MSHVHAVGAGNVLRVQVILAVCIEYVVSAYRMGI